MMGDSWLVLAQRLDEVADTNFALGTSARMLRALEADGVGQSGEAQG
jgi:hypothetical protein